MKVSSIIKSPVSKNIVSKVKTPMRKAMAGAMMMTAVLGSSAVASAKTNNNTELTRQTEVVSIEGAKALSSLAIQSPQTTTERNGMAETRLMYSTPDRETLDEVMEYIPQVYEEKGLFHATAAIQLRTNILMADNMLTAYATKPYGSSEGETHTGVIYVLQGWTGEKYNQLLNNIETENNRIMPAVIRYASELETGLDELAQRTGGKLSAEACLEYIDNKYIQVFGEDKYNNSYLPAVNGFKNRQTNPNSNKGKSDLIAFKTFIYNRDIFDYFAGQSPFLIQYLTDRLFNGRSYIEDYYIRLGQPNPR